VTDDDIHCICGRVYVHITWYCCCCGSSWHRCAHNTCALLHIHWTQRKIGYIGSKHAHWTT